jgi:hypothetical protein
MPDEITRVDYYIGAIANKMGEGAKVLDVFLAAGVNLTGFLAYPKSARNAEVIFVVDEKQKALGPVGKKAGAALGKKQKAFFVTGDDRPGAVLEHVQKIAAAGLNIVSVHAMCSGEKRYGALIAVAAADMRKAAKALGV